MSVTIGDYYFDNSYDEVIAINDIFEDDNKPAIFVNCDSEELSYAFNTMK
mgnify:CR=1 FL=1